MNHEYMAQPGGASGGLAGPINRFNQSPRTQKFRQPRHHALDAHAKARVEGDGLAQERDAALLRLVDFDSSKRNARVVVDGQMYSVSTLAMVGLGVHSDASNPVADAFDSAQAFGVDVDQLTGNFSLVTHDWFGRLQGLKPR